LAAIDLGTVTSRLLIADVCDGDVLADGEPSDNVLGENALAADRAYGSRAQGASRIHEIERQTQITHLGEHLFETGRISTHAIKRELAACEDFLEAIQAVERRDGLSVERVTAVATSAMRDAENSDEVVAALSRAGLDVEVITGEREARLSFLGTLSGFSANGALDKQTVLTVDVGGGSTELISGEVESLRRPRISKARSFNMGSRRVSDRFLKNDPPTLEEITQASTWVTGEAQDYFAHLEKEAQIMIAVAGTATTVVSVRDAMVTYDPQLIHGIQVTASELDEVLRDLANMPLQQREGSIGLEPSRASVIIGGLITLQAILKLANLQSFTVSETDILHGILLD
jgi:exopolyphosphatase/guanosine-5'-triphosphate,3'-diphosphate pyrophosphatase